MCEGRLVVVAVLAGCSSPGAPVVTPSTIAVDDQSQPLRIEGVAAADYLTTTADQLVLAADYRAVIGGTDTIVGIADATGVTVTLARPLPIGSYPLDLVAGARAWHVDHALDVVPVGSVVDAGLDAPRDAAPDGSPAVCFGTGLVNVCPDVLPTGDVSLLSGPIDTDSSPLCVAFTSNNGTVGCLIAAHSLTVNGGRTITASGSRPLILLATTTITIAGGAVIDVASHVGGSLGAGSPPGCPAGTLPIGNGGGYGGSFGGRGGSGGKGGTGGSSPVVTPITTLVGGCPGSDGGGANVGHGGRGGGAVFLLAGTTLTVGGGGSINASGASGLGGVNQTSGAGGGGSGGLIGLEAATITIGGGAQIFANGGAGGEGSDPVASGAAGSDSASSTAAAIGGTGGTAFGGDGGGGSIGATLSGPVGHDGTGGGGGGGGAGVITLHAVTSSISTVLSPPAS